MPSPYLLVPVALEALVVNRADQKATGWCVAPKQYTGLSRFESIEPPPFVEANDRPLTGVTLHWALPDGLTRGRRAPSVPPKVPAMIFPSVPNRWLVVRTAKILTPQPGAPDLVQLAPVQAWVVESDVLGASDGTPYPDPSDRTQLTRLGHKRTLQEWLAAPSVSNPQFRLTTLGLANKDGQLIGAADPAFSAYVANIDNIFSCCDSLLDLETLAPGSLEKRLSLSYMVMGWYESAEADPLHTQSAFNVLNGANWSTREDWLKVMSFWGWSVGDDKDLDRAEQDAAPVPNITPRDRYPSRTLCHGMVYDVKWTGLSGGEPQTFLSGAASAFAGLEVKTRRAAEGPTEEPGRTQLPQIAIGNSTSDALASTLEYLLQKDDSGVDISTLFQALNYGLATSYDQPGGAVELDERIHQEWFSSSDGGSYWDVAAVSAGPSSDGPPATTAPPVVLTPLQLQRLNELNTEQQALDGAARALQSTQLDLYFRMWKSVRLPNLSGTPPGVALGTKTPAQFYRISDPALASDAKRDVDTKAADRNAAEGRRDAKRTELKTLLGTTLEAKENKLPRYWRPADPVVVVYGGRKNSKHGGDGRFRKDGTLFCRFSGQQIRNFEDSGVTVSAESVIARFFNGIKNPDPAPADGIARLPEPTRALAAELVFLNPTFAPDLVTLAGAGRPGRITHLQQIIWADFSKLANTADMMLACGFTGVRPSPVAVEAWAQPWAPLFMSWRVTWFPSRHLPQNIMDDWQFNGLDFDWTGTGLIDESEALTIEGRSILSATSTASLSENLTAHLAESEAGLQDDKAQAESDLAKARADVRAASGAGAPADIAALNAKIDSLTEDVARLTSELATVATLRQAVTAELEQADLLVQPITGFHDQLIMRDRTQYFDAPPGDEFREIGKSIEGGPRMAPIPHRFGSADGHFYPIRAGHFRLDQLWVVDGFGQIFDPIEERGQTPQSFAPLRGSGLVTAGLTQRTDTIALQLPPRLVQPARMQFRFADAATANGLDGADTSFDFNASPICGWLLPNHLDHSLTVFDSKGQSLGAVLLTGQVSPPLLWQPTIASPSAVDGPASVPNPHVRGMMAALFAQPDPKSAFIDLMESIDATLWTSEPLGKRGDNLSILIGRPIALVRARLQLELAEAPATRQLWEDRALPGDPESVAATKRFTDAGFKVQLGHIDLRDDGTLGFFAPVGGSGSAIDYSKFLAVHPKLALTQGGTGYVRQSGDHFGSVMLKVGDAPLHTGNFANVTLLVDPRGSVHARCGILPSKALRLPRRYVAAALEAMNVTFRVGPVLHEQLTEPRTLRMPLPVNVTGSWSWIAQTGVLLTDPVTGLVVKDPQKIETATIAPASQQARIIDQPMHIREGYLRLSDAVGAPGQT